jgi:hypothetical protein
LFSELKQCNSEYENKLKANKVKDSTVFALCWNIDELTRLKEDLQKVRVEIGALLRVMSEQDDGLEVNIPLQLANIRQILEKSIRLVARFQRVPATHMFVIMISCELRDHKPYALPIQCLPCKALKERDIREIVNGVLREMVARNMKVRGTW